jgi:hypothetical protein
MEKEKKEEFEVWVLPTWASGIIMETLAMDAESSMIEHELREQIKKAYDRVGTWTVPIKTEEEPLQEFIGANVKVFKEYYSAVYE